MEIARTQGSLLSGIIFLSQRVSTEAANTQPDPAGGAGGWHMAWGLCVVGLIWGKREKENSRERQRESQSGKSQRLCRGDRPLEVQAPGGDK